MSTPQTTPSEQDTLARLHRRFELRLIGITILAACVLAVILFAVVPSAEARSGHALRGEVRGAQAGLPVPFPLPSRLTIHRAPCPYNFAGTLVENRACAGETEIWISARADRFDRWHETGHVFDTQVLTDADRETFTRLLGIRPGEWVRDSNRDPSEFFADAYAACALGLDPDSHWVSGYGYEPTRREYRRVCHLLRSLG